MPERISDMLAMLAIILEYGRHLLDTIEHRACRSGFSTIAQFFGTTRISVILAHLHRGVMRAMALERMLRERAKHGRDLLFIAERGLTPRAARPSAPPPATPAQPSETPQLAARRSATRTAPEEPLTLDNLPSQRDIDAEVRRRPIGRTLVAICCDLGIGPFLCHGTFHTNLYMLFRWYGGSFSKYFVEMRRRQQQFERQELDRNPALGRPAQTREDVKRFLGFFIGEPPCDPFALPPPPPAVPGAPEIDTTAAPARPP